MGDIAFYIIKLYYHYCFYELIRIFLYNFFFFKLFTLINKNIN